MEASKAQQTTVGSGATARNIAVLCRPGGAPGLFWLSGYTSDMNGTKATALDAYAAKSGIACTRFDYSGHGQSGGDFLAGTISDWREEAIAIFDRFTTGPQIAIGSSMGGWIALLLADGLRRRGEHRLAGLILIAPATDMTKALMWDSYSKKDRKELTTTGVYRQPGEAERNHNIVTLKLIEDGAKHLFGERLIETGCPVHILHGTRDDSVPWQLSTALVARLASDDVVLTLVKDGDHRLSRPEDIERMIAAVAAMRAEIAIVAKSEVAKSE
jgi:pimeloyl-ACP methyl ester carboxylesterase